MIVEADAGEAPLGVFVGRGRQRPQRWPLDRLIERAAADAEVPHRPPIQLLERRDDRRVALGKRKEGHMAQPAEDVSLGEADSRFYFSFRSAQQLPVIWAAKRP